MSSTFDLLNATRRNKDNEEYKLFDTNVEADREPVLLNISRTLDLFRKSMSEKVGDRENGIENRQASGASKSVDLWFESAINRMTAIRVDGKDRDTPPMCFLPNLEQKKRNGVMRAVRRDGIMILVPELLDDSKSENASKGYTSAKHTLVHEFIHIMSCSENRNSDGKIEYEIGLNFHGKKQFYDDLTEGLTEYYTRQMLNRMYPGQKIDESRYPARMILIDKIMSKLDESEKNKMFELFVTGRSHEIADSIFSNLKTPRGLSLLELFDKADSKGVRIGDQDKKGDFKVAAKLSQMLDKFEMKNLPGKAVKTTSVECEQMGM